MKIENLTIKYKKRLIIDNISFSIPKNKITVLLGKNGSGKSSIIKCMKNMVKYEGKIFINDQIIEKMKDRQISHLISYMAQNNNFSEQLTVKELLDFARHPYSNIFSFQNKKDKKIISYWVKKFNLYSILNKSVNKISGGQRQIVQLAAALIQDTPFIILDEPNNNLDIKHNVGLMKIIKSLQSKTIIIVSHDINNAIDFGDHILLIDDKRIVYEGSPKGITHKLLSKVYEVNVTIKKKLSFESK